MNFDLSEEQTMLVDGARRYVRENLGIEARRAAATQADGFSRRHWADFAEMGWLALSIPEDAGGLGGGDVDVSLLMEELGRGLAIEPYADTSVLGATLINAADNKTLRTHLLGLIAAGECITALAHVEPDGRSEYQTPVNAQASTTANGHVLTGIKTRVPYGAAASRWLVTARLNNSNDFSLFVVDRDAGGLAIDSYEVLDGTRAADLTFTQTPAQVLIANGQRAAATLELALDRAVIALAAWTVGSMEAVMALTADYLKQRSQFGQTLSKFQALQHRMSEMFIETDQARSMLMQALAALEDGNAAYRAQAVSGAKALITNAAYFVTGQGIQLHGGIGITEEYAVGHHYKSTIVHDKRLGDRDFHLIRSTGLAQGPR
jgi:alkylation response protein AidB-like acyl-CoA dehydrogenase